MNISNNNEICCFYNKVIYKVEDDILEIRLNIVNDNEIYKNDENYTLYSLYKNNDKFRVYLLYKYINGRQLKLYHLEINTCEKYIIIKMDKSLRKKNIFELLKDL
uniref:Uncharacterized protein n=1 Tax=Pithovirus LCDPAC02 TaxID=2506601 RepID=A0A481YQC6_9VIRU|nr:MAG: hypothetical protein LCDPAC02_03690 [Pithovirus LCDPAC02]